MKRLIFVALSFFLLAGCTKESALNLIENQEYQVIKMLNNNGEERLGVLFPNAITSVVIYFDENNTGYMGVKSGNTTHGYDFVWKYQWKRIMITANILDTDPPEVQELLHKINSSDFSTNRDFGLRISKNEGMELQNNEIKFELVKK